MCAIPPSVASPHPGQAWLNARNAVFPGYYSYVAGPARAQPYQLGATPVPLKLGSFSYVAGPARAQPYQLGAPPVPLKLGSFSDSSWARQGSEEWGLPCATPLKLDSFSYSSWAIATGPFTGC